MSGGCPYCGAKLNYGIRFCVVCGRPISGQDASKVTGGMRGGMRPADITRRLEDLMTVAKFKKSKRATHVDQNLRWLSLNFVSITMGILLFFVAVKISIDGGMFKKTDSIVSPFTSITDKVHLPFDAWFKGQDKKTEDKAQISDKSPSSEKAKKKKTGRKRVKRQPQ